MSTPELSPAREDEALDGDGLNAWAFDFWGDYFRELTSADLKRAQLGFSVQRTTNHNEQH